MFAILGEHCLSYSVDNSVGCESFGLGDNMSVCTLLQGVRALETPWQFLLVKRWMVRQRHMRVDRANLIGITQHFRRFHYNQENVIKRQQESA